MHVPMGATFYIQTITMINQTTVWPRLCTLSPATLPHGYGVHVNITKDIWNVSSLSSQTGCIPPELGGGIVPWAGGPVWMKRRKGAKLRHSSRSFQTVKTMWPSYRTLPPPWKPWIVSSNGQPKIKSSSLKLLLGHKNKKHNYYIFLLPLLSITIPFWGLSGLDLVSPWSQPFFGLGLW